MKPLGRFRPEPPRRPNRAPFGLLVTASVVAIWTGLYGLFVAGFVDEQTFFVIIVMTAPVAFFPVILFQWEKGLAPPNPMWPPIDVVVPWPLEEDRKRAPRRAAVNRKRSRRVHPPNTNGP